MIEARTIDELSRSLRAWREQNPGKTLGLVPTMGAFHAGHLSLIQEARESCDFVVVSIFVNPIQFNDPRDLEKYPSDNEGDLGHCKRENVDLVFLPEQAEMFPEEEPLLKISMPELTRTMCGPGRPGHFEGVLLIVARLFNLVGPDRAYFGQKDYQQLTLIERMVRELNFPLEIVACETYREEDGLAMSSRNLLLEGKAREDANLIYRALKLARQTFEDRDTTPAELQEIAGDIISSGSSNTVEYVDVVDPDTLERLESFAGVERFIIAAAVKCYRVRLIDNLEVRRVVPLRPI